MKLIPNKGYAQVQKITGDALNDSPYMYEVLAVAEDSPLLKVGERVIIQHITLSTVGMEIAAEEDVLAWVEGYDDRL